MIELITFGTGILLGMATGYWLTPKRASVSTRKYKVAKEEPIYDLLILPNIKD